MLYFLGCHAAGNVVISDGDLEGPPICGGFVGEASRDIINCYVTGNVTCGAIPNVNYYDFDWYYQGGYAGGLIGGMYLGGDANIINSYATGDVNGGEHVRAGGFAGHCSASVLNCYATGDVETGDNSNAGGFIGFTTEPDDTSYIENCYSAGSTAGGSNATVGGFIAAIDPGGHGKVDVINGYWNRDAAQRISGSDASKVGVYSQSEEVCITLGVSEAAMTGAAVAAGEIPYYTSYVGADNTVVTTATSFVEALNGGISLLPTISGITYLTWWADPTGSNGYFPILAEDSPEPSNPTHHHKDTSPVEPAGTGTSVFTTNLSTGMKTATFNVSAGAGSSSISATIPKASFGDLVKMVSIP